MIDLFRAGFRAIVGSEHLSEDHGIVAVAPADSADVAAVMRVCAGHRLVVTPAGGRTKIDWDSNAATPDVVLDTLRLSGVREHSAGDLTATVGAGTRWSDMQAFLARQGQRVALDPIFPQQATVGGVLSANDSGVLRLKYGSLRDFVLGMTIVLADGTIARTGGKVVKNVAGYDLPKLLTGSFGTLGIIAEATFRLHPLPQSSVSFTVRSPDVVPLTALMSAVLRSAMSPEAMQMRVEPSAFALDVQFVSLPEVLREHEERLRALAGSLPVEAAADEVWSARDALFRSEHATLLKVTALPSKLTALVAGVAALGSQAGHAVACVADPVGIMTMALNAPPAALAAVVDDLRARLLVSGGAVVVLRRGQLPAAVDTWGPPPAAIEVMRAVKLQFDPHSLINPGYFVGGI